MSIADALRESGLESADAELLAASACGRDRTWIIAHANEPFDLKCFTLFQKLIARRRNGEPLSYILGTKEFYGRSFHVTPDTLIPRPATEELVSTVIEILSGKVMKPVITIDTGIVAWSHIIGRTDDIKCVVDVGTGSGCIAVTLACECPELRVIATDISEKALHVAQENARTHAVYDRITFRLGSGLAAAEPITEPFLLVSNPPYIPEGIRLERDVADFEPASALFAGKNGTDVLHPLVEVALGHPMCRGFIIECREEQITPLPPNAVSSEG